MLNKKISSKILLTVSSLVLLSGCHGKKSHLSGPYSSNPNQFAVAVKDRVHFDFDSSSLNSEAKKVLDKQATWIKNHNFGNYLIAGHADERGTREYNLALGERRANSVKKYLIAQGVKPELITTISFGKENPVAFGHDEAAWNLNRRAVTSHKLSDSHSHHTKKSRKAISEKANEAKEKVTDAAEKVKEKAKEAAHKTAKKVYDATEPNSNE